MAEIYVGFDAVGLETDGEAVLGVGNAIQVRQRLKETIVGNTLLLISAALLKGMGDDDDWTLNGFGPDPTRFPEEAKAWRRLHTPFAIERTGRDGQQEVIPFQRGTLEFLKGPLMLLAGTSDARLNSRLAREPEPSTTSLLWGALRQLGLSSITTGMRNTGGLRDVLQRGMDGRKFGSQAGFMASPLMPYSGTERWIRTWSNPERLDPGFLNNLPFAHYRDDARPALNLFGQPLYPTPSATELTSKQSAGLLPGYTRTLTPDDLRLHGWMQRTGKQPTTYSRREVEKIIERPLTDAEWYTYTAASGKSRHSALSAALDGTLPIPRTITLPNAPDIKTTTKMKRGLLNLDPTNQAAMREANEILQTIGQSAHTAGLAAIDATPPPPTKPPKKPALSIY